MIIRTFCTLGAILATTVAMTASLPSTMIASKDKSACQIVIPNDISNIHIAGFIKSAAELVRDCVSEATGITLVVIDESRVDPGKTAIYIGNTKFARDNGVDTTRMPNWSYVHKSVGDKLILAGADRVDVAGVTSARYTHYILGSVKAVTVFLEQHLGVKFLLPGKNGIHIPSMDSIPMPSDLDIRQTPPVPYNTSRPTEIFYDIANNFFQCNAIMSYGGHSYYLAVPAKTYAASHPEYFALLGGKRNSTSNHLCISNPEVRELIYAEMLKQLDLGYEVVSLGQTDGYLPCECDKCASLPGSPDPGEALWIFHRQLAERLQKDRPGKKVLILAYQNTEKPPKTFNVFPDNVMIEMCLYSPGDFNEWSKYRVPGGFIVYIYNWGNYQRGGITPHRTPSYCRQQAELFMNNNVKGIYKCGFGELFGLEGPQYYVFGRSLANANNIPAAENLVDDFCNAAYGSTAAPMKRFFAVMHERLTLYSDLIGSRCPYVKVNPANPRVILAYNFSPEILESMERNLAAAEKIGGSQKILKRLQLLRKEFDYLKNLASIIHLYNAFKVKPSWSTFDLLGELVQQRNAMIDSFYQANGKIIRLQDWPDIKFLGGFAKDILHTNGRMTAVISSPLTWDFPRLKKAGILPGTLRKHLKVHKAQNKVELQGNINANSWKNIPADIIGGLQLGKTTQQTRVKCQYDDHALYIALEASLPIGFATCASVGHDGPAWQQECFEIFLDPEAASEEFFHLIFNPVENSWYDALNSLKIDPLDPKYGNNDPSWNAPWEYHNYFDKYRRIWTAYVIIPFSSLNSPAPKPGSVWRANFARAHYIPGNSNPELHLWSPNLETARFGDSEIFGELFFED